MGEGIALTRTAKMPKNITWVHEAEAAKMLGYTPEWFRRMVKAHKLQIRHSSVNNRKYQYVKEDIERVMLAGSTVVG